MLDLSQKWRNDFLVGLSTDLGGEPAGLTLLNYEDLTFRTYLQPPTSAIKLELKSDEQERIQRGFKNIKGNPNVLPLGTAPDVEELFRQLIRLDLSKSIDLSYKQRLTAGELLSVLRMPPFCLISGAFLAAELTVPLLEPQIAAIREQQRQTPPYRFSGQQLTPFFYVHPAYNSFKFKSSGLAELYELVYSTLTGAPNTRDVVYWAIPIYSGGVYRGLLFAHSSGGGDERKLKSRLRVAAEEVESVIPYLDLYVAVQSEVTPPSSPGLIPALSQIQPLCFAACGDRSDVWSYHVRSAAEGQEAILRPTSISDVVALRMLPLKKAERRDDEILVGSAPPIGPFDAKASYTVTFSNTSSD